MKLKINRTLAVVLGCLVTLAFLIIGKGHDHAGSIITANAAIALTAEEAKDLNDDEKKFMLAAKKMVVQLTEGIKSGKIDPEEAKAFKDGVIETLSNGELKAIKDELKELDKKAKDAGTSLSEITLKLDAGAGGGGNFKSIAQVFKENEEEIKKAYEKSGGTQTFLVQMNAKGEMVMSKFDPVKAQKAATTHATVAGIDSGTAAVAQSIDAATLLRIAVNAQIVSNYRNTPWILEQVNVINVGWENPFAIWYEEQAVEGGSTTVAEGATKPKVKYSYEAKSATYKKEAVLIGFTDEFSLDFSRLQADIMGKARVDLINNINTKVLTGVKAAATSYNTGTQFTGGTPIDASKYNDYMGIAAMAAQVDNATYGSAMTNTALMSTFKKYRLGTEISTTGEWIDRPSILDGVSFIGNPDMGADDILVGDLKAYNMIMRGGFLIKVGYNGTDFAENKFSVVMEQFYYDYISTIRKAALVKGPTFTDVKGAIAA